MVWMVEGEPFRVPVPVPVKTLAFAAEMNRHHYSLYVHNCRLVFLLRRDFTQVDTFRPAEFHWKLEQVRGSKTSFGFEPVF